jgi:hypothetical protein
MEQSDLGARRQLNTLTAFVFPSLRLLRFSVGPYAAYQWIGQNTQTSETENTNFRGAGWDIGIAASLQLFPRVRVFGSIPLQGTYAFSETTASGQKREMDGISGGRAGIAVMMTQGLALNAVAETLRYSIGSLNGVPIPFTQIPARWSFSFGLSLVY